MRVCGMELPDVQNIALPAFVRRSHRIIATIWLVFLALTLAMQAVGVQSLLVTIPLVVTLVVLIVTGSYLLLRPWVRRFKGR